MVGLIGVMIGKVDTRYSMRLSSGKKMMKDYQHYSVLSTHPALVLVIPILQTLDATCSMLPRGGGEVG